MTKPVCAILGVGPGNGQAIADKFSAAGYAVALCARRGDQMVDRAAGMNDACGYAYDVTDEAAAAATFAAIAADLGPVDTVVFNAGSGAWGTIDDLGPDDLRRTVDVNATGLFIAAQAALPQMRAAGGGNIVVIGAGAALRGRPGTIAFAAGKAAQRSVAQSLARQLGPDGIHVSYIVLDGVVDLERTRARLPDKPDSFFLTAAGVADAALTLASQDRQAWSFEIDLRPFAESW